MFSGVFSRRQDADDISKYPVWRIGLSCSASWTWGLSILFGIAIMYLKGVVPAFAWIIGNILAVPAMGFFIRYIPASSYWTKFKSLAMPLFALYLFVEYFAMIINLNGAKAVLSGKIGMSLDGSVKVLNYPFIENDTALIMVILVGVAFVWFINRWGLKGSVLTDIWQYIIQLGAVMVLALSSIILGGTQPVSLQAFQPGGTDWALFGFVGIFFGAFGAGHQWQRLTSVARKDAFKAGLWSGFFFGLYMVFVLITAVFFVQDSLFISILMLIILLTVGSSTVDSTIAAMQFVTQKAGLGPRLGSFLAIVSICSWPFMADMGVLGAWSFMAAWRWKIVLIAVLITIAYQLYLWSKNSDQKNTSLI